jgi:hypothetical protein
MSGDSRKTVDSGHAEVTVSFRERLPRVYELKDALVDPSHPDAYFQNFEEGLAQSSSKLNAFLKLEG